VVFADATIPSRSLGILLASCFGTFAVRSVLLGPAAFARRAVVSSGFNTIAAFARAPLSRLIFPSEPKSAENLSAFVARFDDVDAVLRQ
jgi:hypothetical protein